MQRYYSGVLCSKENPGYEGGLLESLGRHQSHIVTGTVRAEPKDAAIWADPYTAIGALNHVGFFDFSAAHFALDFVIHVIISSK